MTARITLPVIRVVAKNDLCLLYGNPTVHFHRADPAHCVLWLRGLCGAAKRGPRLLELETGVFDLLDRWHCLARWQESSPRVSIDGFRE